MNERERLIESAINYMHDNPFDVDRRCVLADIIEESVYIWQAEALRAGLIPLTSFDRDAAISLRNCRFAPATFDKRFADDIASRAKQAEPCLTPRQWLWMWILIHRYRRSNGSENATAKAKERYNRCVELLDVKHLKPIERHLSRKTELGYLSASMFASIETLTQEDRQ